MKIFLNPGHAEKGDPGACGNGLQEWQVARNVGEVAKKYLEAKGFEVMLYQVPYDDGNPAYNPLAEICEQSNSWNADIFVSIHCNSVDNPKANGTETFHAPGSTNGKKLADKIYKRVVAYIPELTDRGVKSAAHYVTKNTDAVASLVELAFVSNAADAQILYERQDDFAKAIADGVADYVGVSDSKPNASANFSEVDKISVLTHRYESNGDPSCVSSGVGDVGGISYGSYQYSSAMGVVDEFVDWLIQNNKPFADELAKFDVNSSMFISKWREIGTNAPETFGRLQDEFSIQMYFSAATRQLKNNFYDVDKHSTAIKAVVFSRAIQNGVGGCSTVFKAACSRLGHPNLSYVDDIHFDKQLIAAIYDFLIEECDNAQLVGGIYRSANNLCRGSAGVIEGLRRRFINEKADAIHMLD